MLLVVAATDLELASVRGAEVLRCGIGPVEAAATTALALADRSPDAIVHVGVAGAFGIEPPGLVLGSESIYCDLAPIPWLDVVARTQPDAALLAKARAALPEAAVLPIATSAVVGGGSAYAVEAMEGFGVLRVAELAGVPAVELRAVSNAPDEADRGRWRIVDALGALEAALPRLLEALAG